MPNKTTETMVNLGRLNNLSDGVFAIALTLLVLDIRIPDNTGIGQLSAVLIGLAPKLLIYLISFIVIGGAWGSHQRMVSQIERGDGLLVWFNLLSLLFVTLIPACAALLGSFPDEFPAIACFAADVILIQLSALWLWHHASTYGLLNPSLGPRVVRSISRRLVLSAVGFGLAVALAVLNASLVYIGWIALSALLFTTDWLSWQQVNKTTQVAVPLDGAVRGQIEVLHGAGRLNIVSGARVNALVEGTCQGNVDSQVTHEGDLLKTQLTLRPERGLLNWRYPWAWEIPAADWNLSLNPQLRLALQIKKGAGELDLDFSGTHLTQFSLDTGSSAINVRLPTDAGQTAVHIRGGNPTLAIRVPPQVAARIRIAAMKASLDVDVTRFPPVKDGAEYCSSTYNSAANRVEIHLEMGAGSVKID